MAHATLQRYAQELLVVAERIDITVGDAIDSAVIEAAADHWPREQNQRQRASSLRWSRELFVQTATDWLRFLGRLEVPKPPFGSTIQFCIRTLGPGHGYTDAIGAIHRPSPPRDHPPLRDVSRLVALNVGGLLNVEKAPCIP
jgi:hypothetical protein